MCRVPIEHKCALQAFQLVSWSTSIRQQHLLIHMPSNCQCRVCVYRWWHCVVSPTVLLWRTRDLRACQPPLRAQVAVLRCMEAGNAAWQAHSPLQGPRTLPLKAITVGSLPCVITTVRARLPFSFGNRAICTAKRPP